MTSINATSSPTGQSTPVQTPGYFDPVKGVDMMGSEASLRKIMASVEVSLASSLPEIRAALESGDVATANRLLHAIKGYVPIFCTQALVVQVTQVELLSKTEGVAVVQPAFAELAPKFEALLREIRTYVAQA